MIVLPGDLAVDPLGYSKAERLGSGISADNKAKLLAELSAAGLSGAPLSEQLDYLNTPKEYEQVPDTLYGSPSKMAALAGFVQDRMMAMPASHPAKAQAASLSDMAYKRSQLIAQEGRNAHRDAPSTKGLANAAIALGLLTQAEFDAHFTELPEGFQPILWKSPASHVIGSSVIVESEDLA